MTRATPKPTGSTMNPSRRLLLKHLAFRASEISPQDGLVSSPPDGERFVAWPEVADRSKRLATALVAWGVKPGDRVATLAFNDHRHIDAYFAVPCLGATLHPINVRWNLEEMASVLAHTRDRIVFVDASLMDRAIALADRCPWIERLVRMGPSETDDGPSAVRAGVDITDHDELLASSMPITEWPDLEEHDVMAMCSTSGTTGIPKTVAYTHRTTCLQTMALGLTDCMRLSGRDTVLAIVPMFHALGWCFPYACGMLGSRLVLPHRDLRPERILDLMVEHEVTTSVAVPTVWNAVLAALSASPGRWDLDRLERIVSGGAAPTASMIKAFRDEHGVEVIHSWGMTEINPVGTMSPAATTREEAALDPDQRLRHQQVAGRPLPGLKLEIEDEDGQQTPHDGTSTGRLLVSGWWVAETYAFDHPDGDRFRSDGRLDTGDVASIDDRGRMAIRDRAKDMIKSGGEWISSLALERAIGDFPEVVTCAVIARPDDRWGERPIAVISLAPAASLDFTSLQNRLAEDFERWQCPDDLVIVDSIPLTSTGKIDKKALRARFPS